MNYTPVVLALTALTACSSTGPSGAPPRIYTVEVSPFAKDCMSWAYSWPCLQVREEPGEVYRSQLESIEGFTFEWGHRYRLEIAEYLIADPPADGSDRRYVLRRVFEDQPLPAGTEFTYSAWPASRAILRKDAANLRMFLDLTVPCGEECEAIGVAIDAEHRFDLTLVLTGNDVAPVALVDWSSCPATVNPTRCDE